MSEVVVARALRRADAQRNYDKIVAAARAAVETRGGALCLEEVARDAGVGIGTLYRHFPTRQDLLDATFLNEVQELAQRARELAGDPDAFDALVVWLRLNLDLGAHGHAMGASVMAAKHVEGSELFLAYQSMREAAELLLERAKGEGQVRASVNLTDLAKLVWGLVMVCGESADRAQTERMFQVIIDGIRA